MVLELSHVKSSDILNIYQNVLEKKFKFVIFPNGMNIFDLKDEYVGSTPHEILDSTLMSKYTNDTAIGVNLQAKKIGLGVGICILMVIGILIVGWIIRRKIALRLAQNQRIFRLPMDDL